MKVNDILNFLNSLYPVSLASDFDNVGLLLGDENQEVKKVLLSLDCTDGVAEKAIAENCELIITHHPIIFSPIKNVLENSIVYKLIANGISVISMHTNLDMADGGVNDCLCEAVGLTDIKPITAKNGFILKSGRVKPQSADEFAKHLKTVLGGNVKYVCGKAPIERLLVCSGSGGEFLSDALQNGFDGLLSADIKHHEFLEASHYGISLFDAGHFETEDVVINPLAKTLSANFGNISFIAFHDKPIKCL